MKFIKPLQRALMNEIQALPYLGAYVVNLIVFKEDTHLGAALASNVS
jgi:hypothetical protein